MKLNRIFNNYYIIVFFVIGCAKKSVNTNELHGSYKSKQFSNVELAYRQFIERKTIVIGNHLNLFSDSTFKFESCGNFKSGNYEIKNDSLILYIYSNIKKSDSNTYAFEIPYDTMKYVIKNEETLIREWNISSGRLKGYKQLDYLIKTNTKKY